MIRILYRVKYYLNIVSFICTKRFLGSCFYDTLKFGHISENYRLYRVQDIIPQNLSIW
jgi:hypothetical protein